MARYEGAWWIIYHRCEGSIGIYSHLGLTAVLHSHPPWYNRQACLEKAQVAVQHARADVRLASVKCVCVGRIDRLRFSQQEHAELLKRLAQIRDRG